MRIKGFYINGFGVFNELTINKLSGKINLFFGDNEAGKSTLMAYIRQILFNFPRKNETGRKQYQALNGGRLGGSLDLVLNTGEDLTITRYKDPTGNTITVRKSDGTEGGNNFLIPELKPDRELLFRNIFAFSLDELQQIETLEDDKISTFISSASYGINSKNLLNAYSKLDKRMESLFKQGGKIPLLNQLLKDYENINSSLNESQKSYTEYEILKNELEKNVAECEKRENELDGLKEKDKKAEMLVRLNEPWSDLKDARTDLFDLPDIKDFPHDGISRLKEILSVKRACDTDILFLEKKLKQKEKDINEIKIIDSIIENKSEIKELTSWKINYENARNDYPKRESELKSIKEKLDEKLKEIGMNWDVARLLKADISIQTKNEIRDFTKKLGEQEKELNKKRDEKEEIETDINKLKNAESEIESDIRSPDLLVLPVYPAYISVAVSIFIGFIYYFFYSSEYLLMASVLFLFLTPLYLLARKMITDKFFEGKTEILKRNKVDITNKIKDAEEKRDKLFDEEKILCQKFDLLNTEWQKWLEEFGLRATSQPEGVYEIIHEIEKGKDITEKIRDLENRINSIKDTINHFEEMLSKVIARIGVNKDTSNDFLDQLTDLDKNLDLNLELKLKKDGKKKGLEDVVDELDTKKIDMDDISRRVDTLLAEGQAENEEDFRKNSDIWELKNNLLLNIKEIEKNIHREIGSEDENMRWLEDIYSNQKIDELRKEEEDIKDQLNDLELSLKELYEKIGRDKKQIQNIEEKMETTELLYDSESLKTKINELGREWAVNKLSRVLISEVCSKYEKERQPGIFNEAGKQFSIITKKCYNRIVKPIDGSPIYIEGNTGKSKSVKGELSRGTAEELYLSIRLGLIRDLSKREEPLPIIMDDIFVNMDDYRAPAAVGALKEIMETNQLLVFTCHKRVCDYFWKEYPDLNFVDLNKAT